MRSIGQIFFSIVIWVVLLGGLYWIFAGGGLQTLQDQYFLATYHPSDEVAALAAEDGMHGKGLTLFYESNPQIVDSNTIQKYCPGGSGIEVFGCYDGQHIYVLNITNPQLRSQMGTAAAHEMLHAAYSHLSKKEKQTLDPQLEAEVDSCNSRMAGIDLTARLQDYAQSEPGQRDNELHSILGTECTDLSVPLEQYYSQYFLNRNKMVSLSTQYNGVFASALQGLENDKSAYLSCTQTLNSENQQIAGLESQMNADNSGGNAAAYNALVPEHNTLVDEYNSQRDNCISLQGEYNSAVDQYNQLIGSE